ncbi:MAG TPA: SEC-C domain-containing protein [Candidatus Angelobacter sp.]|jgi:hypothetical protein
MNFKERVESGISPLIEALRGTLASAPTLAVLTHYQLLIDTAVDKSKVPDGFIFKWRYLWALLLANPFVETKPGVPHFGEIDKLIEDIFESYLVGAIYDRGQNPGSEQEFLTRLGLAIRVREFDSLLGFPEQISNWAAVRLTPFNSAYFTQKMGLGFEEISAWASNLMNILEARLNDWRDQFGSIVKQIREDVTSGRVSQDTAASLIREHLERAAETGEKLHVFSMDELQNGISKTAAESLTKLLTIRPGEVSEQYRFPHDENPLEYKSFVILPDDTFYFLDPANAHRVIAKTFERELLKETSLRDRYLKNRDRATEGLAQEYIRQVFPGAEIYQHYFVGKGTGEKDLFVRYDDSIILIECKNTKIRGFRGRGDDLQNFESDFENSIQFGYDQANEVKQLIRSQEETTFFDEKSRPYFSVKNQEIKAIYIVCITITPRGPFGTDLSYRLKKAGSEPFPLAINLFDFETVCKNFNDQQFFSYLRARQELHGKVHTGDELNYAGYFLRFGNLDLTSDLFLHDDFSGIFDRMWYRQKGIDIAEPTAPPATMSMMRRGNQVIIESATGKKQTTVIDPQIYEHVTGEPTVKMKGSERNKPCPCGSGQKLKKCHGRN